MKSNLNVIPGTKLNYEHYVPAKSSCLYPLLFIHGMFGGSWQFHLTMKYAVSQGFEVFALNLEGHAPGQTVGASSIEGYVQDATQMLQYIAGPTIVIGHSMGGLIAQVLAERLSGADALASFDPLVKVAVLMSSPMAGHLLLKKEMFCYRYLKVITTGEPFWLKPEHLASLFLNKAPHKESYIGNFTKESGLALRQIALGQTSVDESKVACPVLVVAAGCDKVISLHVQRWLAGKYSSQLDICEDGDHMTFMWSTAPIQMIIQWIDRHGWFHSKGEVFPCLLRS